VAQDSPDVVQLDTVTYEEGVSYLERDIPLDVPRFAQRVVSLDDAPKDSVFLGNDADIRGRCDGVEDTCVDLPNQ